MRYPVFKHFCSYLLNTPLGMFLGVLVFCSLGYVFDAEFSAGVEKFYTFLITVAVSLFVASFALAGVFANIASQREKDEDTRKRKLMAARAKLPMALSDAHQAFDAGIRYSADFDILVHGYSETWLRTTSIPEMTLPDDAINTFLEVIEHHDDPNVAKRLSGILTEYQVFMARWVSEFDTKAIATTTDLMDARQRTVSWAYLSEITESLFDYARGMAELGEVTQDSIRSHLSFRLPVGHHVESYEDEIGLYARTFARRFT